GQQHQGRAPGTPRPGSARNKSAAVRKRRLTLGAAALVLLAAIGVGGWFALSGDDADPGPQDTKNSAPAVP
ncbi:serine/threonine protein kinase, partial [Streptomyces sp. col6]